MKLYIHIGSDKCGSTAIQTSLSINREEIIRQGIYLPKSGLGTNSGHAKCFEDESGETFRALLSELKSVEHQFEFAVISWEGIHSLKPKKMKSHFYQLKEFESVAIYYVRDQAEIIQTGILQQWKADNCMLEFSPSYPSLRLFFDNAEIWSGFLGRKTLVVHYDRKDFPGGDIALDFYAKIGLENTEGIKSLKNDANESLAFESGFLVAVLDRLFPQPLPKRDILVDAVLAAQTQFSLTKYFFSKAEVEAVRAYYKDNNSLLERNYGLESFTTDSSCWRRSTEQFSLHAGLLARTIELYDIPVLGIDNETAPPLENMTSSGWYEATDGGVWADGDISVLKFRVTAIALKHRYAHQQDLHIKIKGVYFASVKRKSGIRINGGPLVEADLTDYTFSLPLEEVPQDRCFEVMIENYEKRSPLDVGRGRDDRNLSFCLQKIRLKQLASNIR